MYNVDSGERGLKPRFSFGRHKWMTPYRASLGSNPQMNPFLL